MYEVLNGYLKCGCTIVLFAASCSLIYLLVYYIREYMTTKICWFCNNRVKVPFKSRKEWFCVYCDQFNGFNKDGSYTKTIPEQFDVDLNRSSFAAFVKKKLPADNGLCHICNAIQELKIKQLAAYVPFRECNYDVEIEAFKKKLEDQYKLCSKCEKVLQTTLNQKMKLLSETIPNFASNILKKENLEYKRNYLGIGAILLFLSFIVPFLAYFVDFNVIHSPYIKNPFDISFEFNFSFILELIHHYYHILGDLLICFFLCEVVFLFTAFPQLCNNFLAVLAGLISTLFMVGNYLGILNISNNLKIPVALAEILILPLYSILSAKIRSWKDNNVSNVNEQFLNHFSAFQVPDNAQLGHVEVGSSEYNLATNSRVSLNSIDDNMMNLKLSSNNVKSPTTINKMSNNPFIKIRDRRNVLKPARFNWNRTSDDQNSVCSSLSSDELSSALTVDNSVKATASNFCKYAGDKIFNATGDNVSKRETSTPNLINGFVSPVKFFPRSFNNINNDGNYNSSNSNNCYNCYNTYSLPFVSHRSLSSSPYYHYSNSILRTPEYGLITAYAIVPTTTTPLTHSHHSSCCTTDSSHNESSRILGQPSPFVNYLTIFNVLCCCFCCYVLGIYMNVANFT